MLRHQMATTRRPRKSGAFLSGIIVGCFLTCCYFVMDSSKAPVTWKYLSSEQTFLQPKSLPHIPQENELSSMDEVTWPVKKSINSRNEDDAVASELKNKVRLLCWVMTSPSTIETKAIHVNATWGRRCNILLFMSSKSNETNAAKLSLPIVELNVPEGREHLWRKTKAAFKYLYRYHLRDADWFFKADDDTYAIVENMRYLLRDQTPDVPVYFGRRFAPYAKQGYMSGGAGYVLSRAAVKSFVTVGIPNPNFCQDFGLGAEDVLLGMCLEKCGVKVADSRDVLGRQRFHPLSPWNLLINDGLPNDAWIYSYDYYPTELGKECCSDYSITFHYIEPHIMYTLDYFVYRMKTYGIANNCDLLEDT